jgi:NTE family protein
MPDVNLHPVNDTSSTPPQAGIALCLSGGGYRAMMFHAGCLWRLNELGLLGTLQQISSVSGGSITSATLGMNWNSLNIVPGAPSAAFVPVVIGAIRKMAATNVDEGAILGGIFLPGSISDHVADKYQKILFGDKTLQDLPDHPSFVINATNVQSGVLMRFSKPYIRDYRVGQILKPVLPLARAVAASSAFPPVLSPCEIKVADYGMHFEPPGPGEDLNTAPYTTDLVLSDGGVYDNLGLETAWKHYDTILVSDGGGHYQAEPEPHHDWARHAYRVLNLINNQVLALRTRQIIAFYEAGERKGCYWSIRQPITTYPAGNVLLCPPDRTAELAATPTRLQAMDDTLQERLINWGYAICDASLRSWYRPDLPKPLAFPYPAVGV